MVQRAVNAKAKANLKLSTMVLDLDAYCLKGYCLFYNTSLKMQIQGFNNKNSFHTKKLKAKNLKSALPRTNIAESLEQSKKNRRNKKQRSKNH